MCPPRSYYSLYHDLEKELLAAFAVVSARLAHVSLIPAPFPVFKLVNSNELCLFSFAFGTFDALLNLLVFGISLSTCHGELLSDKINPSYIHSLISLCQENQLRSSSGTRFMRGNGYLIASSLDEF